jgi:hypothetical protein
MTTKTKRPKAKKPAAKSKSRPVARRAKSRAGKVARPRRTPNPARRRATAGGSRWVKLVAKHGVVLASAHGPVPTLTEAVAGEPIVGSWWAHPKGKAIFGALAELDDSEDVRCFKLIDHKVTFVHRRLWPALTCLARAGAFAADQVASIQQEHMPTGEHRNIVTPLVDWVDEATAQAAARMTVEAARKQLGAWVSEVAAARA